MRAVGNGRACEPAREVGADVRHVRRPFLERKQRVEARDAVRLGRRDREPARRVAERALAHPADALLRGAQRGQEEMALRAVGARTRSAVHVLGAHRARRRSRSRSASLGSAFEEAKVSQDASTRIAVALNSAVPDLRVGRVDRQHVRLDEVGEVQVHEREPGAEGPVERDRRLDRAAPRADERRGRRRRSP